MRICWVARSFLDYRIPVFRELDTLTGGSLFLSFSGDYVPESVTAKAVATLGARAFPLRGEVGFGGEDQYHMANRNFSFRWQPGLARHIRSLSPDVLVCDGFFKWTFPSVLFRLRHGTPLVINYERTKHTERSAQGIRTAYRKAVVRVTDGMNCSGRLCQEYAEELGMPAARITRGHMSADTEGLSAAVDAIPFGAREALRHQMRLDGVIVLYVGRLDERKGVAEMLAAWRQAGFAKGEATLLLVGDGPLREALEAKAAHQSGVIFAGRIPYDQLAPYYALADAFAIATLEDNWSLVVPEAMACGLPILSSVHNGCWPELVRPENGWTARPEDVDNFAGALRALVAKQRSGLRQMGEHSRRIVQDFGPRNAAKSILEACKIALAARNHCRK